MHEQVIETAIEAISVNIFISKLHQIGKTLQRY